jgi:SAM-dependent methyltransferase
MPVSAPPPRHPERRTRHGRDAEEAGGREPFEDAALYDFEYRRRRTDVRFYQRIAQERLADLPGPVLDLACGSGRLTLPLLREGHTVVGIDRSAAMLARARARVQRLSPTRRRRALLLRGDLRQLPLGQPRFTLAICGFHSVQHLIDDADWLAFLRGARKALVPGGWLAFDLLPPDPAWIHRDPNRRWGRTVFRHPGTGQRFVSTNNHSFDAERHALHIRLYDQPIDAAGRPAGRERVRRLCHRQIAPAQVGSLLARAGLELVARFGGFDGRPLAWGENGPPEPPAEGDDEHIYVARRARHPASAPPSRGHRKS